MALKKSMIEVDLTNFREKVSSHVPEGKYRVAIEDAETGTTRNGDPKITMYYRVTHGDYANTALFIDTLTLTEKAIFRLVGLMSALGMKTPRKKFRMDLSKFIGKKLVVEVGDGDEYRGRVKSEVREYLPLSVLTGDEDDEDDDEDEDEDDLNNDESADETAEEETSDEVDDDDDEDDDDVELDPDDLDL